MEQNGTLEIIRIILAGIISFTLPVSYILFGDPYLGDRQSIWGLFGIFCLLSPLASLFFLLMGYSLRFLFRYRLSPLFVDLALFLLIFGFLNHAATTAKYIDKPTNPPPFNRTQGG